MMNFLLPAFRCLFLLEKGALEGPIGRHGEKKLFIIWVPFQTEIQPDNIFLTTSGNGRISVGKGTPGDVVDRKIVDVTCQFL